MICKDEMEAVNVALDYELSQIINRKGTGKVVEVRLEGASADFLSTDIDDLAERVHDGDLEFYASDVDRHLADAMVFAIAALNTDAVPEAVDADSLNAVRDALDVGPYDSPYAGFPADFAPEGEDVYTFGNLVVTVANGLLRVTTADDGYLYELREVASSIAAAAEDDTDDLDAAQQAAHAEVRAKAERLLAALDARVESNRARLAAA